MFCFTLLTFSLCSVNELNAYRAGHACLSLCMYVCICVSVCVLMIQLKNCWRKLDDIMPLGTSLKLYFLIFCNSNTNIVDEQTYGVGSTLVPHTVEPYSDVWFWFSEKNYHLVILWVMWNKKHGGCMKEKIFWLNQGSVLYPHACEPSMLPQS
jgi:hypothetical protein